MRKLTIRNVVHMRDSGDGYLYFDARDHLRISRRRHSDGGIELLPGVERLHDLVAAQSIGLAAIPESLAAQDLAVNPDASRLLLVARVPMETDLYYADRLPANRQPR